MHMISEDRLVLLFDFPTDVSAGSAVRPVPVKERQRVCLGGGFGVCDALRCDRSYPGKAVQRHVSPDQLTGREGLESAPPNAP